MQAAIAPPDSEAVSGPIRLARIGIRVCRAPLERPVETSFGRMDSRPALFVRIEDDEGAFGLGEVWCNFPACGAEHRARLLADEIAPLALGGSYRQPSDLFRLLTARTHVRAIQAGEPGPYAQAAAGLDIALWDLFARRAGLPLGQYLQADAASAVPAYASGIHIRQAEEFLGVCRKKGGRAFKVKIGFDLDEDIARLKRLAAQLESGERLFADANQGWSLAEALRFVQETAETGLGWIEEPLPADAPEADWRTLADASAVPLAGGENIAGFEAFAAAAESGIFEVIQPDAAKWGGVTGCYAAARRALAAGRTYCPHYLGGGIGLLASAHLLAAAGGPGLLEIDANANPLREAIWDPALEDGVAALPGAPGLGVHELPGELSAFRTLEREIRLDAA